MIKIKVNKCSASLVSSESPVSGSNEVFYVSFDFSSEWDALTKKAVFRCGNIERSVLLNNGNTCLVPWEVLQKHGKKLYIGVLGTRGETTVMPTVWCEAATVSEGVSDSEISLPPTPGIYEQMLAAVEEAEDIAASLRDDAENGVFNGEKGEKGEKGDTGSRGYGIINAAMTQESHEEWDLTLYFEDGTSKTIEVPFGSVVSVNGKTGAVSLQAEDVAYNETTVKNALDNKADSSGNYHYMVSGVAENLVNLNGSGDDEEFTFRAALSGNSLTESGYACIQSIYGKTVKNSNGELINMKASAIETVGFNAYDYENDLAEVVAADDSEYGNHGYAIQGPYTSILFSESVDGEYEELEVEEFSAEESVDTIERVCPPSNGFIRIENSSENTCLSLIWTGARSHLIERYNKETRYLPVEKYFPEGMRSAGSAYDELTPEKVIRRIKTLDLGTLNYELISTDKPHTFLSITAISDAVGPIMQTKKCNMESTYSTVESQRNVYSNCMTGIAMSRYGNIYITDPEITSPAELKARLSGEIIHYQSSEPIVTETDSYLNLVYKVCKDGTEKMVSETESAPFSGCIYYSPDYTQTLEKLPSEYIQKNAPSSNGTYVLKCTVNNGSKQYKWVAEE